jgi:NADH-quinone oxidoreductase E subunit
MPYLKKVNIKGHDYFYLFHTVRQGDKFKKLSRYIGKKEPIPEQLMKIKQKFLEEIKSTESGDKEPEKMNVVEILQDLQEKEGYLSKDSMINLAKEMDIPAVNLIGVATFYSMFKLTKSGKHKVSVCTGTACHVNGSEKLIEYLEELLKVKRGETTPDGNITLEVVNCIGACAKAPAMMVDNIVHGQLTKEDVKSIVEDLK